MDPNSILNRIRRDNFMHPRFAEAYQRTQAHAVFGQPGTVIMVLGATRVGKTTLSKLLEVNLTGDACGHLTEIPLIRLEAATTDQGFMSSKYLCLRMLQALKHPFYEGEGYKPRWSDSETTLRTQIDRALRSRATKYIFIDEAHHLLRNKNLRNIGASLDSLKCLANEAGVILVLFGGYELLRTCFESAHLNGRSTIIDFRNYQINDDDVATYDAILSSIDRYLPWQKGQSLIKHRQLIYAGTMGCYGLLIHWISAAIADMAANGSKTLHLKHFIATKLREQLIPIREDIEMGARLMHKLDATPWTQPSIPQMTNDHITREKSKRKPGIRNPHRDPVGRRQ